ncbi:Arrestin (Or S-antigen), partial [Operophtera brumata]
MGIKVANIYLDNQWNTYYAGQTINGRIEYVFDSPKKVRGVHVKFKGEAHTEWYESKQQENTEGKTESTDTMHSNEIEIPSGKQVYNFTCTLPPVLPSSFEGEHGYVRYTVKVTLDRPWKFDQETKMAFTAIPVQIDIENKSNVQVHLVKVFLRKVVTYRATTPSAAMKKTKDIVLTIQEGPAPAGSTKHWSVQMEVPPIPPSNLIN